MSNHQELPPASSGSSVPTPTELLGKIQVQSSAEFTNQPLPGLKLSLSMPKSLLEPAPDIQNCNKGTVGPSSQSMIEMPFSNWKRNCYTLYEVDEKVTSPKVMAPTEPMVASSGMSHTDPAKMDHYQVLTVSSFNWKYQGFRNFSSEVNKRHTHAENQSIKVNEPLSKTQGQVLCQEMNASLASTSVESDVGARKAQSSTDLKSFEGENTSFGRKRNLSASDLKALVGSIFNVSSSTSDGKSKSVPASPMSSPKSQRKSLTILGEQAEKAEGTLSSSQFGNTDHYKEAYNIPVHSNKTGLKRSIPPTAMMSSIVDWATKKKVTVSNSEMNIFAPPSS
ncbi:hypothetical protein ACJMK2_006159 [Sinanodonta woodiana]|uniref:Uncharacterized protein n=1 Tax=Sinanodonta woodiana TaxID=1069815 RepID=A0ABD3VT11_SINWO